LLSALGEQSAMARKPADLEEALRDRAKGTEDWPSRVRRGRAAALHAGGPVGCRPADARWRALARRRGRQGRPAEFGSWQHRIAWGRLV